MCVGCREMRPKKELLRVVKKPDGQVQLDVTGKVSGRGAYVDPNTACLDKAIKQKQLDRALEAKLDETVIEALKKAMNEFELYSSKGGKR